LGIRQITPARQKELEFRKKVTLQVIQRDGGHCVLDGKPASEVHEIVPRSRFGRKNKALCYCMKNMVCLSRKPHAKAHTRPMRIALLTLLAEKYGYSYDDEPWREYGIE